MTERDLIQRTFTAPPDVVYRAATTLGIATGDQGGPWLHRYAQIMEIAERAGKLEALAEAVEADRG